MTPLFWLFCLALVVLVFLVLWILGKPFPRYRGAEMGESPATGQWMRGLLGFLVGACVGIAVGVWIFTWRPEHDGPGFSLQTQESAFLSALCLGAGVGLPLAMLWVWMLTSRETFRYFRAWDAKTWRGLDMVKATPVAAVLLLAMGHVYLPARVIGDPKALHYRTPLPWLDQSRPWSELSGMRLVEQEELLLDIWGKGPGMAWRFKDGARFSVYASDVVKSSQLGLAVRWSSRRSGVRAERRKRDD